ncbi:MAG: response regulator [Bacteroidota bacterium]
MIRALIIDDEPLARSLVRGFLRDFPQIEVLQECGDGFEGLKAIQQHRPDLIFLDIQMPKITGFEMLELEDNPPPVIFTTAFDAYAIKAFEANAIDYLLKPFNRDRFKKAVQKFLDANENGKQAAEMKKLLENTGSPVPRAERVVVKTGSRIVIIPFSQIQWLEADDDLVKIHADEGVFLKSRTLQYFESVLNAEQFVRVHRSYIVNVQAIVRMEPYQKDGFLAVLKSGEKVPVSAGGYARLKTVLGV